MRVLHKGLIIVGVPLVLELLIILSLGVLIAAIDQEEAIEYQKRQIVLNGARLIFANNEAGIVLVKAWTTFDVSTLDSFPEKIKRVEELSETLRNLPPDHSVKTRELMTRCLGRQGELVERMKQVAEVTRQGFSLDSMNRVLVLQKALMRYATANYDEMRLLYSDTTKTLEEVQERLERLKKAELLVVAGGLLLNVIGAAFLLRYFKREFLGPLDKIKNMMIAFAQGKKAQSASFGDDEIAELDRSMHEMAEQLALAAERERALFNNSSDVICVLNEQQEFLDANPAAQRFWGLSPAEVVGKHLQSLLSAEDYGRAEPSLQHCRSTRKAVNFETDFTSKAGGKSYLLWSVFWSEQHKSWYCVVHDVTDQKKLEKLKQSFMELIAADFRKPLRQISMQFDGLASGKFGDFPKFANDKMGASIKTLGRLVSLVDELLHLEQLQSREMRLDRRPHQIKDLILQSVDDVQVVAQTRDITIEVDSPDVTCTIDANQIIRVIINFLSNAVKFSAEGSTVRIVAKHDAESIRVEIHDAGPGISPEDQSQLFQAFKQVSADDGKRGKGTGLGLVICKRIIEQHGGDVGVSSEVGKGSVFWFSIALVTAAGSETWPCEVASAESEQQSTRLPTQRRKARLTDNIGLQQKSWLLIGIPLLLEIVFVGSMMSILLQGSIELTRQMKDRQVAIRASSVALAFEEIAMIMRRAEERNFDREKCDELLRSVPQRLTAFKEAIKGDPVAATTGAEIVKLVEKVTPQVPYIIGKMSNRKSQNLANTHLYSAAIYKFSQAISSRVNALVDNCDARDQIGPEKLQEIHYNQISLLVLGIALNIAAAAGMALFFSKDVAGRLAVLTDNSKRLASGQQLNEPVGGTDEIGSLDSDFHKMAAELTATRAKERAFLDNSQDLICSLDADGVFITVNPASEYILGVSDRSLSARSLSSFVSEKDVEPLSAALQEARASKQPVSFECESIGAEKTVDLQWSLSWSDREQAYFCVARDVSQRKEMDRIKREFLAVVTHDLRTPLTTLSGTTVLLQNGAFGEVPADAEPCLKQIVRETDRIIVLVNDLLDLEKLSAGQMKLDVAEVRLTELLDRAIQSAMGASDMRPVFSEAPSDVLLRGDVERLTHAFTGIIQEATDLLPSAMKIAVERERERVTIRFTSEQCAEPSEKLRMLIQNVQAMTEEINGSSANRLRLPLARKIVEAHQGSVAAALNDDVNLSLQITLPIF